MYHVVPRVLVKLDEVIEGDERTGTTGPAHADVQKRTQLLRSFTTPKNCSEGFRLILRGTARIELSVDGSERSFFS